MPNNISKNYLNTNNVINIVWFRNDLRLRYNKILEHLYQRQISFIPIYIIDEEILTLNLESHKRILFLIDSLKDLDTNLKKQGSGLIFFKGTPIKILAELSSKISHINVFYSKEYSRYALKRDLKIEQALSHRIKFYKFKNNVVVDEEDKILNKHGEPYKIFSHFKKAFINHIKNKTIYLIGKYEILVLPINKIITLFKDFGIKNFYTIESIELLFNLSLEKKPLTNYQHKGGETYALSKWQSFLGAKINQYSQYRNRLDLDVTSHLSYYIRFGCISTLQIINDIIDKNHIETLDAKNTSSWMIFLNEIIWRDFFKYVNIYFPQVEKNNFKQTIKEDFWLEDPENFEIWCQGLTGIPIIDACMRHLNSTGHLHNRGRLIVASFLTKLLRIHWQKGEKYFKKVLVDWDKSVNNGNWQWVAGTGVDAAPYFRIFNPIRQSQMYDPRGIFIRKYVPELEKVSDEYIHEPHKMPFIEQIKSGCIIGKNYPSPLIDIKRTISNNLQLLYSNGKAKNLTI